MQHRDVCLHEIGPNGQGIAALMALRMLNHLDVGAMGRDSAQAIHVQIEAMKIAFAHGHRYVVDPAFVVDATARDLLDLTYLESRSRHINRERAGCRGLASRATVARCISPLRDHSGMMVSFTQSNYRGFGSGVVVPDTGIALHNRGCGFSLERGLPNQVGAGRRPFHTIIPGFLTQKGNPS